MMNAMVEVIVRQRKRGKLSDEQAEAMLVGCTIALNARCASVDQLDELVDLLMALNDLPEEVRQRFVSSAFKDPVA